MIVSAGAYGSPHLLLLSGIGPGDQLTTFGIDVVADLPVGQGVQDHYMTMLNYTTSEPTLRTAASVENVALLQNEGRGPLTSNIGEVGGFYETRAGLNGPDMQIHGASVLFYDESLGAPVVDGYAIGPCVLKPSSRGSLVLRAASPDAQPRILHRHLDTEEDRKSIVEGLKLTLEITRQSALKDVTTGDFVVPEADSDAQLLDYAKLIGQTLYHPTSTCRSAASWIRISACRVSRGFGSSTPRSCPA